MRRLSRGKVKPVHISVHPNFFEKLQSERKSMEKSMKRNFTNLEFTEGLELLKVNFGRDMKNATKKIK